MTPDELDTAIRQELRFAARGAPDAGPVRRRVLLAAEAVDSGALPSSRGLRAWTVPLLAAAAVLLAFGLAAAGQALRADQAPTPPAGSVRPGPGSPTPSGAPSTASARSTPSASPTASASSTPTHSTAAGRPAQHSASHSTAAGPTPGDWFFGVDATTLPHTAGLCPAGQAVDNVAGMGAPSISVAGEPKPLWLVPVTCAGAGDAPRPVEVFRSTADGPQLVQTLAYQAGDPRSIAVTRINVGSGAVTLGESGHDTERDPQSSRSLRFTQTYSWQSGRFVAGPQQDAVQPCTDGQLMITGTHDASQDGTSEGVLLTYANTGDEPCSLTGYPGAAVLATAQPRAEAAQTPSGPLGGLAGGDPARVVLFGSTVSSAVVEWSTVEQGATACYSLASVVTTPPGLTVTSRFDNQSMVCDPQVHPVVYGGTGSQQPAG